jgi:phage terminase large subunit
LLVDPRCHETIREFNQYRYPEQHADRNADETPLKMDDHCMDALRYAVAVWLARAPERERLKQKTNGNGPLRKARERLMERVVGEG